MLKTRSAGSETTTWTEQAAREDTAPKERPSDDDSGWAEIGKTETEREATW